MGRNPSDSGRPAVRASDLILSPDLSKAEAQAYLSGLGFRRADEVDRRLQALAERFSDRRTLARLLEPLLKTLADSPDPDGAWLQLGRFFESVGSAENLAAFLEDNPPSLEVLGVLFGSSPFLTQMLHRNPEYLYWLLSGGRLQQPLPSGYYRRECRAAVQAFGELEHGLDSLRRLHRRELLRMATLELLGSLPPARVMRRLSRLAEATLEAVLKLLLPTFCGPNDAFAVIAMGKLGGGELNFSSDVDLVYVFSDRSRPANMTRLAREYTRRLGEMTGEGRLYRVDLRLRPMGRGGEIAYPLAAYRHFWETGAETFERLALIKARTVAGEAGLGRRFEEAARGFVYRRYLDLAALQEIAYLKERSDRQVRRKGSHESDVKLGIGGIREVEFFVQAFQILYGGDHPELQTASTLTALNRLADAGMIELREYQELKRAYLFLRAVEHRLQLVHDRQVQSVPEDPVQLERLARQLSPAGDAKPPSGRGGGDSVALFQTRLRNHQSNVRRIFRSLLGGERKGGLRRLLLDPGIEEQAALDSLREAGIRSPEGFWQALKQLKTVPSFPHSPARMRNSLANLLPRMLQHAALLQRPEQLVNRLDRFCETLGSRVPMYQGLVENPDLADRCFQLLALEGPAETLIRQPELLDTVARTELREPPETSSPPTLESPDARVARSLARYRTREEFKLAVWELRGADPHEVRRRLTRLAESCLRRVCRLRLDLEPEWEAARWTLFALGKLGGHELTYQSDLDLILVYDPSVGSIASDRWEGLVRSLRQDVEADTPEGRCYRLDFRLRPEGRRASQATPLTEIRRYFEDRAQGWERLAYVKLRPVFQRGRPRIGPESLFAPRPLSREELEGALHLRRRKELELGRESDDEIDLKVGRGGLMDLMLMVHDAQLARGVSEVNTRAALRLLSRKGAAPADLECLDFRFRLEAAVRLQGRRSANRLTRNSEAARLGARMLGWESADALWDQCLRSRESLREAFQRYFSDRLEMLGS